MYFDCLFVQRAVGLTGKDYILRAIQKPSLFIDTFLKLVGIEESALNNASIAQKVRSVACLDSL